MDLVRVIGSLNRNRRVELLALEIIINRMRNILPSRDTSPKGWAAISPWCIPLCFEGGLNSFSASWKPLLRPRFSS